MQINIYRQLTNQTSVLLVQRAQWRRATVILSQSLYFSLPPPPTAVIPVSRPLGTFENKDGHSYR